MQCAKTSTCDLRVHRGSQRRRPRRIFASSSALAGRTDGRTYSQDVRCIMRPRRTAGERLAMMNVSCPTVGWVVGGSARHGTLVDPVNCLSRRYRTRIVALSSLRLYGIWMPTVAPPVIRLLLCANEWMNGIRGTSDDIIDGEWRRLWPMHHISIYPVSQRVGHVYLHDNNFGISGPIFIFFRL